ncbi:MAG: tetratricopeptide repeat protein [Chloroflexi bacterium]|nr:tetratricopeptide repeat protein [Chloroflexota bacterium]
MILHMHLRGSNWSMKKRRRRSNPWLILFLLAGIGFLIYLNTNVIPAMPPPFVPTPTPTRDPASYSEEAESYLAEGRIGMAKASYEAAIKANPQEVSNYLALAKLQLYSSEYEAARVNAENALLLDNTRPYAYSLLAWAKGYLGEYLEAEADVRTALGLDPMNAFAHAIYANILARRVANDLGEINTLERAIEHSQEAMAIDSQILEVRWARGYVLEVTGNYEEAIEQLLIAVELNDTIAEVHMALGRNYFTVEEYDLAIRQFTKAYSLNPSDPDPNWYISRVYSRIGEFAKAVQYAEQAVNDDPTNPRLHGNLGSMYFRNLQYNQAIESLQLAVRGGVTSSGERVEGLPLSYSMTVMEFYSRYGLALARVNRCNEAVQVAQAMLQTVPDDITAVYNAEIIIEVCQEFQENPPTPTPVNDETFDNGSVEAETDLEEKD